jgi:hypothetical protein
VRLLDPLVGVGLLLATVVGAWFSMPFWQSALAWLRPLPSFSAGMALTMAIWGGCSVGLLGIGATGGDRRLGGMFAVFLGWSE